MHGLPSLPTPLPEQLEQALCRQAPSFRALYQSFIRAASSKLAGVPIYLGAKPPSSLNLSASAWSWLSVRSLPKLIG